MKSMRKTSSKNLHLSINKSILRTESGLGSPRQDSTFYSSKKEKESLIDRVRGVSKKAVPRFLTHKQLKDNMKEIYTAKRVYDKKC